MSATSKRAANTPKTPRNDEKTPVFVHIRRKMYRNLRFLRISYIKCATATVYPVHMEQLHMTTKTVFAQITKSANKAFDATFVMSAADLDRTNDTIDPKAYDANTGKRLIALWQHSHNDPVGYWENMRKSGRQFIGDLKLAGTELARMIKQLLDDDVPLMASIGFQATDAAPNDKGGYHFKAIDIYECSVVSVGAHPQAIRIAKSYGFDVVQDGDQVSFVKSMAATGKTDQTAKEAPRALGKTVSINSPKVPIMKTFAEQIKDAEARKAELSGTVKTLMAKAADEGRTLDATEAEGYDSAMAEIDQVEKHIGRLQAAEKLNISTASPVVEGDTQKGAAAARSGIITSVKDNLPKGIAFARYAKCLALAKQQGEGIVTAKALAERMYPDHSQLQHVFKAVVASGTTQDPAWAGVLADKQDFLGDFVEFLRGMTIMGRFGRDGIPDFTRVPFHSKMKGQDVGFGHFWTGESSPIGVTKGGFNEYVFGHAKINSIVALSNDLLRLDNMQADIRIRNDMAEAIGEGMDLAFIKKANAGVSNVKPASVLNGLTPVAASGTDLDALTTDVSALFAVFNAAKVKKATGVWVTTPDVAEGLYSMKNAFGMRQNPDMARDGGFFEGYPVIVSENVDAGDLAFVIAKEIWVADDGAVTVRASEDATLEMNDAPTGTATRSMFQHDETALRASRWANWKPRRAGVSAGVITGAAYKG